jgi:hypothetical protein
MGCRSAKHYDTQRRIAYVLVITKNTNLIPQSRLLRHGYRVDGPFLHYAFAPREAMATGLPTNCSCRLRASLELPSTAPGQPPSGAMDWPTALALLCLRAIAV